MNLWGTLKSKWSIGRTAASPMLKNNAGVLEVKRTDDASMSVLRCADASGDDDVVNKRTMDTYLSSRMHYLTSAAEITAAFADTSPGYHNYVVAPGVYTFTADVVVNPSRYVRFLPGVSFLMNNNSKLTTGKVAGVDYYYGSYDQQAQIQYVTTRTILGKSVILGAAFDWSAVAAVAGVKLMAADSWFDVASYTATTITPPAEQMAMAGSGTDLSYRPCALIVPCSGVEVEGDLLLTAGAGHDGIMITMPALFNARMGNWHIKLVPPAVVNSYYMVDFRFCGFGSLPQIKLENKKVQFVNAGTYYVAVDSSFSHGVTVSPRMTNLCIDTYRDAGTTFRVLDLAFSSGSVYGADGLISGVRVSNTFAGRTVTAYGVQSTGSDSTFRSVVMGGIHEILQEDGSGISRSGNAINIVW